MGDYLTILFTILSVALPGAFKRDHLPDWMNGSIALGIVGVFSLLTVLVGGKFTSDPVANWLLFSGIYGAILAGPGKPLDDWLTSHFPSPNTAPEPPGGVQ